MIYGMYHVPIIICFDVFCQILISHFLIFLDLNAGKNLVGDSDINAVTGVLKLYFRELPEPLFTDQQYKAFVTTVGK